MVRRSKVMASKPGTATVVTSVATVTWGGWQAGSTVAICSWTGRSLRSASIPPLLLASGPLRVPSRVSCLSEAANPVTVRVPANDSSALPPVIGTVPPGAAPAELITTASRAARQTTRVRLRFIQGLLIFEPGDLNGRTLGTQIGSQAWAKAQTYFNGSAGQ
jgi:hypothetical protein